MIKTAKPKAVHYTLIKRSEQPQLYGLLDTALSKWHGHLNEPHVLLFWRSGWKPDKDGHLTTAQIFKSSDDRKEMLEHDLIIYLNQDVWHRLDTKQQLAVMDHELCHADITVDEETEDPIQDERGRTVYRIRKHDLEEFEAVIRRHGLYTKHIAGFANTCNQKMMPGGHSEDSSSVDAELANDAST